MVAGTAFAASGAVDVGVEEAGGGWRGEEEVVDAPAGVAGPGIAEDGPEGPGWVLRVDGMQRVGPVGGEEAGELGAGLGLEEGVLLPGALVVDVGWGGDGIAVAGEDGGDAGLVKGGGVGEEALVPG